MINRSPHLLVLRSLSTASRSFFTATPCSRVSYRRFGDPPRGSMRPTPTARLSSPSAQNQLVAFARERIPFRLRQRPPTIVFVVVGGAVIYYLVNLERVEATGRIRFMDVSPSLEKSMAATSFAETMHQYQRQILPRNHPTSKFVREVAGRIVAASGLDGKGIEWEVFVVQDPTKNAFVLPGGKIFVFTGILDVTQDATGLGIVLGHEVAHQVARHSSERLSSMKVLFAISLLLSTLGFDIGLSRMLLNLVMTLPNSRTAETEADYIGLQLATRACYDPRAAKLLWNRMEVAERSGGGGGGGNVDFLSTHPASSKRAAVLEKLAKEMILLRPPSCGPLQEQQMSSFRDATLIGGTKRRFLQ